MSIRYALIWCLLCAAGSLPARASESADRGPLAVHFRLLAERASLGEPIVLNYRIENTGPGPIEVDWQREDISLASYKREVLPPWLQITVTGPSGQQIPFTPDPRKEYVGDTASGTPRSRLDAGRAREGQIVLSTWFHLPSEGRYQVNIAAHLPYHSDAGSGDQAQRDVERSLPLLVTLQVPDTLRRTAERLRSKTLSASDPQERIAALKALLSMPEEYVYRIWREVVTSPRYHFRDLALGQLSRMGSPGALELARAGKAMDRRERTGGLP